VELDYCTLVIDVDHVNIELASISMRIDESRVVFDVVDNHEPALLPLQFPDESRLPRDRAICSDVCSMHEKIEILVAAGCET
jgi:hypothetical protein